MLATPTYTDLYNSARLKSLAEDYHQDYVEASPFPHICIDNVFPTELLNTILAEFPALDSETWRTFNHARSHKLALFNESLIGPQTLQFLHYLNSSTFLTFLETLTGIEGLIPDPHLNGGGLHNIPSGGFLKIHADFNVNEKLKLDRRLNLLLYLNQEWEESYGGHLELWDKNMQTCEKRILPIFNRMVVFSTTDTSFHGHPDPVTCPPDRSRKSIAMYYYTNGRPKQEQSTSHTTLYKDRPNNLDGSPSRKKRFGLFKW